MLLFQVLESGRGSGASSPFSRFGSTSTGLLLSVSLLSAPVYAAAVQTQFEEHAPKRYFPAVPDSTTDVSVADFDGDGDLDALTANTFQPARLYLNDGEGVFTDVTATHLPTLGSSLHRRIGIGDIDGDGDPDALLTSGRSASSTPLLLVNDGTGHFIAETEGRLPPNSLRDGSRAMFGDVDGDLDLDLVCPDQGGTVVNLFLNDGAGFFTDASASRMPALSNVNKAAALADVDGDLDLDLVLANNSQDRLYLNDGLGFFTDVTATHLPVEGLNFTLSMALADVDGDLDLDMIVGDNGGGNTLRLNNGLGVFSDASSNLPTRADASDAITTGDVDGDGDADIVFGNQKQSRLYLNDGAGIFVEVAFPAAGFEPDKAGAVQLADVDGDDDLDLLMGRAGIDSRRLPGIDRVYLNDGSGGFTNASPERVPWSFVDVAATELIDLDLDGDLDLVSAEGEHLGFIGNTGYGDVRSYLNDGTGTFPTGELLGTSNAVALAVGDVDGDVAPDVLIGAASLCFLGYGCFPTSNELYLNDGAGGFFRAPGLPADSDDSFAVAFADFDGDGDLDALFGNWRQQNRLYLNDGAGTFTDVTLGSLPLRQDRTRALATGDFDADGDIDIVVGNEGEQSYMYVNEEQGVFVDRTATRMPPLARKTRALGARDMDLDGDLDLVLGNDGQPGLYLNNGEGKLLDYTDWMPPQPEETWALRIGDMDEDGDMDVLLGNRGISGLEAVNRLLLNDGTARFADSGRLPSDADRTAAISLGDIDGDRDLDVICGDLEPGSVRRFNTNRVYLNLHRQLEARLLPILGRTYELEVHAEPGYASGQRLAVIAFSFALLDPPVTAAPPLQGTLFLQGPLRSLPLVTIPMPGGYAKVELEVPNELSLLDVTFYAQAAILGGGKPRLTGYLSDTFQR